MTAVSGDQYRAMGFRRRCWQHWNHDSRQNHKPSALG
jgi:hypothetical protein